jgi:hypothetical protein
MKNEFGVIELTKNELIECNGGMVMLIIMLFTLDYKRFVDFVDGVRDGYERATNA